MGVTAPTTWAQLDQDMRVTLSLRDRAEERVNDLRAQLDDALANYRRLDERAYGLRRQMDGFRTGRHFREATP